MDYERTTKYIQKISYMENSSSVDPSKQANGVVVDYPPLDW